MWDLSTGKLERRLSDPRISEYAPFFSPDGRTLAIRDGRLVHLLDWPKGTLRHTLEGFRTRSVAFTPDSRTLAGVGEDERSIHLWDLATGRKRVVPEGHAGAIGWATPSPDGRLVAGGCSDQSVRMWEGESGKLRREVGTYRGSLSGMAFSLDGRHLAWAAQTPRFAREISTTLAVCDLQSGKVTSSKLPGWLWHPRFSADGRHVVMAGGDRLRFWDVEKAKEASLLPGRTEAQGAVFAPDGGTLAIVTAPARGRQAQIDLWDLKAGKLRQSLKTAPSATAPSLVGPRIGTGVGPRLSSASVQLSTDSGLVVAGDSFGRVHVWDVRTGALRRAWQAHDREPAYTLALSADGKLVATATNWREKEVRLWEVATGKQVLSFSHQHGPLNQLAFLPDGRRLLTGDLTDGTALIWDLLALANATTEAIGAEIRAREAETLWQALADPGIAGFRALARLARAPGPAVALLQAKLQRVTAPDPRYVERLIQGLDADTQPDREKATRSLEVLGERAAPALRQALGQKPSPEKKRRLERLLTLAASPDLPPEQLRQSRAVQALEWIGAAEARRILGLLAAGDPLATLTHEAKSALKRLEDRGEKR